MRTVGGQDGRPTMALSAAKVWVARWLPSLRVTASELLQRPPFETRWDCRSARLFRPTIGKSPLTRLALESKEVPAEASEMTVEDQLLQEW